MFVPHKNQYIEFKNQWIMVLGDGALGKKLHYRTGTSKIEALP